MTAAERLLTARELAELLGLSPATVLDRFERGDLPGFRLFGRKGGPVRFRASEVQAMLEGWRVGPLASTWARGVESTVREPIGPDPQALLVVPADASGVGENAHAAAAEGPILRPRRRPALKVVNVDA